VESNDIDELVVAGNPMSLVHTNSPRKHAEIGAVGKVRTNPRLFFLRFAQDGLQGMLFNLARRNCDGNNEGAFG
jgi:hypothetical protein